MCSHNDAQRENMKAQIKELEAQKEKYSKLVPDIGAGLAQVNCYRKQLAKFKGACSGVRPNGNVPIDKGRCESQEKELKSVIDELTTQKAAAEKEISNIEASILNLNMTIRYLDTDCASCKAAAAAAAAAALQPSKSSYNASR